MVGSPDPRNFMRGKVCINCLNWDKKKHVEGNIVGVCNIKGKTVWDFKCNDFNERKRKKAPNY